MSFRHISDQSTDQIIAKGGLVVGTAVTAQSVTEIAGSVGAVLGIAVAVLSIALLWRRNRIAKLEIMRLEREIERWVRESDNSRS